jgi:hypothetical protein
VKTATGRDVRVAVAQEGDITAAVAREGADAPLDIPRDLITGWRA